MFVRVSNLVLMLALGMSVVACGKNVNYDRDGNFKLQDAGPDEFAIVPTKELQLPEDFATLPEPVLGAKNRVDQDPKADAVVALGGNAERLNSPNIGAGEQALVNAARRNGVAADIRTALATEDEEFRGKKGRGKWIQRTFTPKGRYLRQYKDQALDANEEYLRLRQQGVRTPSVGQVD